VLEIHSKPSKDDSPKLRDARLALLDAFIFPEIGKKKAFWSRLKGAHALTTEEAQTKVTDKLADSKIVCGDASESFKTVEDFLLPERIRNQYFRLELAKVWLSFPKHTGNEPPIPPKRRLPKHLCEVFLTVYPSVSVAILMLNIELSKCDVDDLIMLQQSSGEKRQGKSQINVFFKKEDVQPSKMSLHELATVHYINPILKAFNGREKSATPEIPHNQARCIEICGFSGSGSSAKSIPGKYCRQLYGLLAMDEGWRFVPVETAKDRMQLGWRTRDFFNVIAFEETVAVINLEQRVHYKYVTSQRQLKIEYDHEPEPYFEFPTKIAGLKNGALLMLENAFLQLFIIEQFSEKFKKKGKSIRKIEMFREELLTAFQNLSCINIPEIDLLERKVLKAMKVSKVKKELQNKLEQVEDSLVLKYNQRFNRLILWLTVVGTIVAVLTILNGIGVIPKI
jgi:hypothetical protein